MRKLFLHITILFIAGITSAQQMQVKKNDYHSFLPKQKNISQELIKSTSEKNKKHPEFGVLPYNAPCEDCYELLDKRTTNSRYFVKNNSNGKDFYLQKANGALNYADALGNLKAIDWNLYPTSEEGIYEAASQPLPTKIDLQNNFTSIKLADQFEFIYNRGLKLFYTNNPEHSLHSEYTSDYSHYTAGKDGAYITEMFSKTDCEIAVRKGAIKTNFILKDKNIIEPAKYLVIEDFISLPAGYTLKEDDEQGYYVSDGFWKGNISLFNEASIKLLTIQKPLILDQAKTKFHNKEQYDAITYHLIPGEDGYYLQIIVETKWLLSDERKYPVIIDPTLIGEATYTASDIGFEFNATCFDTDDYCNYFLDVTVPGKTTLTAAYFDGTYYSQNFGCFFTTDCLMKEAAFRILGPCDDSPSPTSYWTCLPPEGDTAGTCYGIDLDMFNTIACIPPQCEDYEFTFEMRTFMCSCTKPPCDITCHYMPSGSWVITIEGKTVEENNIVSDLFPEFTICQGDTIDLSASGIWGVPPYTYEWEELGLYADTVFVFPDDTTVYTSIIHDVCDMQDTVYQIVNVIPAPTLSPGPFEACYDVIADAGGGYTDYLWNTGETTQTIFVDSAGIYFVTVTDENGCSGISDPVEVILHYPPEINAYPDTIYVENGELAEMHVSTESTGDVTFSWQPITSISCGDCPDPYGIVTDAQETFTVTGEEFGCVSEPDTIIVINSSTDFFVPNVFSPNDDFLNDLFMASSEIFYPVFKLQVYDRWGEKVFESDDMLEGWNGLHNGAPQEVGTYMWIITYEKLNRKGVILHRMGTVILLR